MSGILSLATTTALPQAGKTADRSAEIDAFGGFTGLHNDYISDYTTYGVTLGADYTQFIKRYRGLITPSFEVRGTIVPGSLNSQRTLEGGLKLATTYRRLHPYGDFLLGDGVITFPPPPNPQPGIKYYVRDSTIIYVYGGGLTYDIKPNWSLMADYQHQYWDLGSMGGSPPNRFYPDAVTLGVVFHIPFKAYKTR